MDEWPRNWYEWFKKLLEAVAEWVRRCLPQYEPAVWNDANGIQYNNNCYNYGCDKQTGTYAQPGRAHGIQLAQDDCRCDGASGPVHQGAVADGLVPVDCDTGCGCKECWHKVALVMWPGHDYHWYRLDRNGRWSHKIGWSPATDLDNSNNAITDPRTADRGGYTVFCGCYCVNKKSVSIQ